MGWAAVPHGMQSVDFSNGTMEFHTRFDDGTMLVTTSIEAVKSKPEVGIYVRSYEDIPIAGLWEKHLDGIQRFRTHRATGPVDHSRFQDVTQFLTMTHETFRRFLGLP